MFNIYRIFVKSLDFIVLHVALNEIIEFTHQTLNVFLNL